MDPTQNNCSPLRQHPIQIQQHVRHHRPRRQLLHINPCRRSPERLGRHGLRLLAGPPGLAADDVDGPSLRGYQQPAAWVVGDAVAGPPIDGTDEGVLDGLLRQVEVADRADEGGERPPPLLPEQAL